VEDLVLPEKTNEKYNGMTEPEVVIANKSATILLGFKDSIKGYNGQWRGYSVNKIASLASKHVDAIEINGENIPMEQGKEMALDIINYGRMLFLKYRKGEITGNSKANIEKE